MPVSDKTRALTIRRWKAFCKAVVQAEAEHGAPLTCYFGESQVVADQSRLAKHHDCECHGGSKEKNGGSAWDDGGATLLALPHVDGFHQDGGGW